MDHSTLGDLSIVIVTETSSDSKFMDAIDSLVLQADATELEELGFRIDYDNGWSLNIWLPHKKILG